MGGAKSQRRRAKLALDAQYGNLYKAQFGKASKSDKLPEPPLAKQLAAKTTRSFRKMQALMVRLIIGPAFAVRTLRLYATGLPGNGELLSES